MRLHCLLLVWHIGGVSDDPHPAKHYQGNFAAVACVKDREQANPVLKRWFDHDPSRRGNQYLRSTCYCWDADRNKER